MNGLGGGDMMLVFVSTNLVLFLGVSLLSTASGAVSERSCMFAAVYLYVPAASGATATTDTRSHEQVSGGNDPETAALPVVPRAHVLSLRPNEVPVPALPRAGLPAVPKAGPTAAPTTASHTQHGAGRPV